MFMWMATGCCVASPGISTVPAQSAGFVQTQSGPAVTFFTVGAICKVPLYQRQRLRRAPGLKEKGQDARQHFVGINWFTIDIFPFELNSRMSFFLLLLFFNLFLPRPSLALFTSYSPLSTSDIYPAIRFHVRFGQYRCVLEAVGKYFWQQEPSHSWLRPFFRTKGRALLYPSPSVGNPLDSFLCSS